MDVAGRRDPLSVILDHSHCIGSWTGTEVQPTWESEEKASGGTAVLATHDLRMTDKERTELVRRHWEG